MCGSRPQTLLVDGRRGLRSDIDLRRLSKEPANDEVRDLPTEAVAVGTPATVHG